MAKCKYCQKEIAWIKEGRKNVPVEGDGSVHKCPERQKAMDSYKKLDRDSISKEEIERYEKAMNEKAKK
ncbi:MAG: hypothetical protein VYD54_02180 [Bdellovibrionota bacterium]|nr:hypothetical protein [Bdellovibrionota bacterium]